MNKLIDKLSESSKKRVHITFTDCCKWKPSCKELIFKDGIYKTTKVYDGIEIWMNINNKYIKVVQHLLSENNINDKFEIGIYNGVGYTFDNIGRDINEVNEFLRRL
jgi:hypothetical protein